MLGFEIAMNQLLCAPLFHSSTLPGQQIESSYRALRTAHFFLNNSRFDSHMSHFGSPFESQRDFSLIVQKGIMCLQSHVYSPPKEQL